MVREIFELWAGGEGLKGIAKRLNAAGASTPRAQQGRRSGWAPSSVREVLHRPLYRGEIVWNRTKKRDAWGQKRRRTRPEADWLSIPVEALRIVPEALWRAAHARMTERRSNYDRWKRGEGGAPDGRGVRSRYFLTGFGRCAVCGGSMQAVSRASSAGRNFRYVCATYGVGARMLLLRHAVPMLLAFRRRNEHDLQHEVASPSEVQDEIPRRQLA